MLRNLLLTVFSLATLAPALFADQAGLSRKAPFPEVLVEGGSFMMGLTDDKTAHQVTLSSFVMATTEVTQALYESVVGKNPSSFTGDSRRPVENVSWYDTVAFCNKLSTREGLKAAYTVSGDDVSCDWSANGWRLPTEAEWEFAARGGKASRGCTYSGAEDVNAVAWYSSNSDYKTRPVGTKASNELELYDMSGNVWEWCWDRYGDHPGGTQADPAGGSSGEARVLRGGSWYYGADFSRVANRYSNNPGDWNNNIGFRVIRRPQ